MPRDEEGESSIMLVCVSAAASIHLHNFSYHGTPHLLLLQNMQCPRGEQCPYAHSVFEYWLHPSRFVSQSILVHCFAHDAEPIASDAAFTSKQATPCLNTPPPHHTHTHSGTAHSYATTVRAASARSASSRTPWRSCGSAASRYCTHAHAFLLHFAHAHPSVRPLSQSSIPYIHAFMPMHLFIHSRCSTQSWPACQGG